VASIKCVSRGYGPSSAVIPERCDPLYPCLLLLVCHIPLANGWVAQGYSHGEHSGRRSFGSLQWHIMFPSSFASWAFGTAKSKRFASWAWRGTRHRLAAHRLKRGANRPVASWGG